MVKLRTSSLFNTRLFDKIVVIGVELQTHSLFNMLLIPAPLFSNFKHTKLINRIELLNSRKNRSYTQFFSRSRCAFLVYVFIIIIIIIILF